MKRRKKYLPMGDRTEREEFKIRGREQDRDGERKTHNVLHSQEGRP